jgi:hypothetical protein
MTETINFREQIAPENLTPEVELILQHIGDVVIMTPQSDDEDSAVDFEFPNETAALLILGDDAWGGVTGAFVDTGHLVLVANYGDEGEVHYSLTSDSVANKIDLTQICMPTLLSDMATGEKRAVITFTPTIAEKQLQLMKDTLTTAIEGGINYWAKGRNFEREEDLTYVSCELRPSYDEGKPFEDGDRRNDWQKIGPAQIEAAMLRIINEKGICAAYIREAILMDYIDPDSCRGDAETADVIIQVALFGEIVFG